MAINEETTVSVICPKCGAPVTSEICPYCGAMTGLDTASANMEYPVLECKEAHLNIWNLQFPAVFAGGFGLFGVLFTFAFSRIATDTVVYNMFRYIGIPFLAIGIVALFIVLKNIYFYLTVQYAGKYIEGTVYGYADDNFVINNKHAQTCKILLHTPDGPRFIMYQLGDTAHPYGINDKVALKVYKNRYSIIK